MQEYTPPQEQMPSPEPQKSGSGSTKWIIIGAIGCLGLPAVLVVFAIVLIGALTLVGGRVSEVFSEVDSGLHTPIPETSIEVTPFSEGEEVGDSAPTQDLAPVVIGDLEPYTHPSGLFTMDVPANWHAAESSFSGEVIVNFSDPFNNGGVVVDIFEDDSMTDQQLADTLAVFIEEGFQEMPAFVMEEPEIQPTGGVWLTFYYDSEVQGSYHPMVGRSFISRTDDKVTLISYLVPEDQFAELSPSFETIFNSYQVDTSVSLE